MTLPLSPPTSPLDYAGDGRASHWLVYHVLLVTRRRRRLFASREAASRLEELLREVAAGQGCEILACEVAPSSVVLQLRAVPGLALSVLVTRLQQDVVAPLKAEFEDVRRAQTVFVRRYMVTSVPLPKADIQLFARGVSKS